MAVNHVHLISVCNPGAHNIWDRSDGDPNAPKSRDVSTMHAVGLRCEFCSQDLLVLEGQVVLTAYEQPDPNMNARFQTC